MALCTYECLFLLDPNKASADFEGVTGQVTGLIERIGGEVIITRPWGEPKLAYPIEKFRKGTYFLTYFKAESKKIPELEAECKLSDVIVRHMVLKLHPHLIDQVLAHLNDPGPGPEEGNGGPGGERGGDRGGDRFDRGGDRDRERRRW